MKKEKLFPGFNSYEDVLDIDKLNSYIGSIDNADFNTYRNAPQNIMISRETELYRFIEDSLSPYLTDYFKEHDIFFDDDRGFMLMKYSTNMRLGGHSDDHGGYSDPKPRMSLVFYINDTYDGGEIRFKNLDISIKPKKNQLIIFPSSYLFFHVISKVTDGERFIITNFYS